MNIALCIRFNKAITIPKLGKGFFIRTFRNFIKLLLLKAYFFLRWRIFF